MKPLTLIITNITAIAAVIVLLWVTTPTELTFAADSIRLAPGDDKTNYEKFAYQTNSLSLEYRKGTPADLLSIAKQTQLGLPEPTFPNNNKPDQKKITLGKKLFFDRRLSRNKTMSCAMCHIPEQGFTNNELARPIGFEGRGLKRNAPTILNVSFYSSLFADQREFSLEQQVWSPLLATNEMNNPSVGYVVNTVSTAKDYQGLFESAFSTPANMNNISMALAQYQRSLVSANSRFDRWLFGNEAKALSSTEIQGYQLFVGKAGCVACHTITEDVALFTDNQAHNTGLGYQDSMLKPSEEVTVQLAPGIETTINRAQVDSVGLNKPNDLGRYEVTLNPSDRWKFRTSSLRNIALTSPYMHNGEFLTLEQVVEFYNKGGIANDGLSPLIKPLGLNKSEVLALVAFLHSLTGANVATLVSDAFTAPIGDVELDDTQ